MTRPVSRLFAISCIAAAAASVLSCGMGRSIRDVVDPAPTCGAYPTAPDELLCGEERLYLCSSRSSCEARLIDQLALMNVGWDVVIRKQSAAIDGEKERDDKRLGVTTSITRWLVSNPAGETIARLEVVQPESTVEGWTAAACFSQGERARTNAPCRRTLEAFIEKEVFPVQKMNDDVAPPSSSNARALALLSMGSRGIYYDPATCAARVLRRGVGEIKCVSSRLVWQETASSADANTAVTQALQAFGETAEVVRRRALPCHLDDTAANCVVIDARAGPVPAGHISTFARVGKRTYAVGCTWTRGDTMRPAPLCTSVLRVEGL